ncbi:protein NO VEIN domain-containing protein [Cloacibacterium sp.]|uniref:protein NO VEIN domain-containing protein n=1 Tax=Cloacibacterium sp. TaxID=1913682 RepID=UPI0039E580A9
MFFKLHSEGKIGYKQLTEADLGRTSGNTTHIGLFGNVLTFLPDHDFEDEALFLYNNTSQSVPYFFDRITRENGDINSPKIKKGGKNIVSVTTLIQGITNELIDDRKWFLLWFGLESGKVVFYLFNNKSIDFSKLSQIIDLQTNLVKKQINKGDINYNNLLEELEKYVNENTEEVLQELEIQSQIGNSVSEIKKYKPFDIINANKIFQETGKKGEELIAEYLEILKARKQIFAYNWYNRNMETGLPYDFHIQANNQSLTYVDVKSTKYKFEQSIIFSNQEIDFISTEHTYNIFRVYDLLEEIGSPKLKICKNIKNLAQQINPHFEILKNSLEAQSIKLQSANMAINPNNNLLSFGNEINLDF